MSPRLRLVVFDVDGTLVDSQNIIMAVMARAFGDLGVELPSRDRVLSIVGLSLEEAFAALAPGLDDRRRARAVAAYRRASSELMQTASHAMVPPLFPGARAALAALHGQAETLLGIATGKGRPGLDHVTAAHGIDRYFVTRQTADGHPSKPHPSMLQAALSETGVDTPCAVMVGDTSFDMQMGRAAGFRTIGVTWGYHGAERLVAAGADLVIGDFSELVPAVEELWT
ncbi:MAG TPA: HAD family hydrolase [Rhodobacteraceae bacterium]|nr:HAD family hydrolase [Paracoccaceae bacterium]